MAVQLLLEFRWADYAEMKNGDNAGYVAECGVCGVWTTALGGGEGGRTFKVIDSSTSHVR